MVLIHQGYLGITILSTCHFVRSGQRVSFFDDEMWFLLEAPRISPQGFGGEDSDSDMFSVLRSQDLYQQFSRMGGRKGECVHICEDDLVRFDQDALDGGSLAPSLYQIAT